MPDRGWEGEGEGMGWDRRGWWWGRAGKGVCLVEWLVFISYSSSMQPTISLFRPCSVAPACAMMQ